MLEKAIKVLCRNLLENSWPAYVTTVDNMSFPQTRAMFNLRNRKHFPRLIKFFEEQEDEFIQIFTTNTSSTKMNDLKSNKAVSVYYCDPDTWRGVMFSGVIEIVSDSLTKETIWHPEWSKYYPEGYNDPDHTVLCLLPTVAKGWSGTETFRLELR